VFRKIQDFYVNKNQTYIATLSEIIPQIRANTTLAFQMSENKKGLEKIQYFTFMCLWLNVFSED
jgi:hypothetical protein